MGTKRRLLYAVLLVAILGTFVWLFLHPRDPVYEGKPLTQWVDEVSAESLTNRPALLFFEDARTRKIRQFGPSAVPSLIAMFENKHSWKKKLSDFLGAHNVRNKLATDFVKHWSVESLRPQSAAYFLGCLGPDAEPAIPALMTAAVNTNRGLRIAAMHALGAIHRRQEVVAPFLVGLATNSNQILSLDAISELGAFTEQPEIVVPALVQALSNNSGEVYVVITASRLRNLGSNAISAVPTLRLRVANTNLSLDTQYWVADALQRIAPDSTADATVPVYIKMLETRAFSHPHDAILNLYELGPHARTAVPALLEFISRDGTPGDGAAAAYALKAIDPEAATRIWASGLSRSQAEVHSAVFLRAAHETREQFTAHIVAMKERAVPHLIMILEGKDASYAAGQERQNAAYLLGEMGQAARAAIPALIAVTKDLPPARTALMKIRGQSPAPLIEQLKDTSDWLDWRETAAMVSDFGTNAEPAIPMILAALQLPYAGPYRSPAALALGEIHRRPEICLAALIPLLGDPSPSTRKEAIEALAKFGKDAKPALPQIMQSLEDFDYYARMQATNTLKAIDPEAAAQAGVK